MTSRVFSLPAASVAAFLIASSALATLDEDFESGFAPGTVHGQNGWAVSIVPALPPELASIVFDGEPGFGSSSLQISAPGTSAVIMAFSPSSMPQAKFAVDCLYDTPGLATYRISPIDEANSRVITRIYIDSAGVSVLQLDPNDASQTVFAPTTGVVTPGVVTRMSVSLSGDLRGLTVYQDGVVIFTGHNIVAESFDQGQTATPPSGITRTDLASFQTDPGAGGIVVYDNLESWITCPADLNNDGAVDTADLGILIGQFGTAGPLADLNGDGVVDTADLGILIGAFGDACT